MEVCAVLNSAHDSYGEIDERLHEFVVEQIRAGVDQMTLTNRLEGAGLSYDQAYEVVRTLYPVIIQQVTRAEAPTLPNVLQGILGGLLAAIASGIAWAAIVVNFEYELGIAAWGIGFLAGWAVAFFSRGKKGSTLQVIAVLSSLIGIALGKYLTFYYYLREAFREEFGQVMASDIPVFSRMVFELLIENASVLFSSFDVLWVALAVGTAWRILKEQGAKHHNDSRLSGETGGKGAVT